MNSPGSEALVTSFESGDQGFDPNFKEFMKEQEIERNRKFLRHMVRLVRKTIGTVKVKTIS